MIDNIFYTIQFPDDTLLNKDGSGNNVDNILDCAKFTLEEVNNYLNSYIGKLLNKNNDLKIMKVYCDMKECVRQDKYKVKIEYLWDDIFNKKIIKEIDYLEENRIDVSYIGTFTFYNKNDIRFYTEIEISDKENNYKVNLGETIEFEHDVRGLPIRLTLTKLD